MPQILKTNRCKRRQRTNGRIGGPRGPTIVDGVDIEDYAGAIFDFREWCISKDRDFRASMMRAAQDFKKKCEGEAWKDILIGART